MPDRTLIWPGGAEGVLRDLGGSFAPKIALAEEQMSRDAFGRLRVSSPEYVFDAQLTYDLQPLLFEQITARYPITLNAAGAARSLGTISLLATGYTGTAPCHVTLNWREVR